MIAPDLTNIPAFLTVQHRWVLWREVLRNGKPTKKPHTTANRPASSTDARTWASFPTITGTLRSLPNEFDGIGIVLGDLGNGEHACGIDLDSCIDEQGDLAEWAEPLVRVLLTYIEVSPSATGLKVFFRCRAEDAHAVRETFGIESDKWGCKRGVAGVANGKEHAEAIEVYLGPGRYFTVTGKRWATSAEDVALLDCASLLRIAALVREATTAPRDNSRSAIAFRKGAAMRRAGKTFEEMCAALRTDPETADWCREKGNADGGRELHRIWDNATPSDDRQPAIRISPGGRHQAADAGLNALAAAGVPIYQRDRNMVRVCALPAKASDGRVVHVPAVVPITTPILGRALGQTALWESITRRGEICRIDPPKEVVEQIGAMVGEWPFPPLNGVIGTATLRPEGSILATEGYDPTTGLFLFAPPPMPPIAAEPTKQDAQEALALLNSLLAEFPFANDASRSVALSMLLTPVLRGALAPAVPMHCVTAPEAGTGKSYLQDVASCIAVGDRCAVLSVAPGDPKETEKRLIGAALAQQPIIALDNVGSELLMGDFLCQATERPLLQIRPLGTSNLVRISNTFTPFANGNNLTVGADVVRRTTMCTLDADMEMPEARVFAADPVGMALAHRGRYVAACLTIARAYIVAGRPGLLPQAASYGGWSDTVRSPLVWLGCPDPVDTVANVRMQDPIRQARAALFFAWATDLQLGIGYQTAELVRLAAEYAGGARSRPALWDALFAIAAPRNGHQEIEPNALGRWLRDNLGTIALGLKLTVDRSDANRPRWKLEQ